MNRRMFLKLKANLINFEAIIKPEILFLCQQITKQLLLQSVIH